jgi:DNA segregation ATPase FtsK/SpoIIIE-like protein
MAQHAATRRAPPPEEGAAEVIFALLATWRVELCLLAPFVALGVWSYLHFGPIAAGVAVTLLALLVVVPAPNRHLLARVLHKASVRRRLEMAFRSRPGVLADRPPYVGKIAKTNVGDRIELGLRHGTSIEELERAEPILAASLGVRDIRLVVDPARHDHVTLTITWRDPFEAAALPCPLVAASHFDAWKPIPVGVDEEGEIVTLSLPEHNVLFGAEPGGGKSVALSVLVAAFALDPTVTLWLFDGKLVELAPWLECAKRFVGPDIELAISVLEELRTEMDDRYRDLLARKVRKVTPGDGLGLHVVAIDELALYVAGVDKKLASRFSELLRDLVARGRAAGIIVLAATQKPSIDIVPSALRDLFGFR